MIIIVMTGMRRFRRFNPRDQRVMCDVGPERRPKKSPGAATARAVSTGDYGYRSVRFGCTEWRTCHRRPPGRLQSTFH